MSAMEAQSSASPQCTSAATPSLVDVRLTTQHPIQSLVDWDRRLPLGHGGAGNVFQADLLPLASETLRDYRKVFENVSERRVAVKVAKVTGLSPFVGREAGVLVGLERAVDKGGFVKLYCVAGMESGTQPGEYHLCLLLELCQHGSVWGFMQQHGGKLGGSLGWSALSQACLAVHIMHDMHIVHRDLKPENMLIRRLHLAQDAQGGEYVADMEICLSDFHTCAVFNTATPPDFNPLKFGTPIYSAPELLAIASEAFGKKSRRVDRILSDRLGVAGATIRAACASGGPVDGVALWPLLASPAVDNWSMGIVATEFLSDTAFHPFPVLKETNVSILSAIDQTTRVHEEWLSTLVAACGSRDIGRVVCKLLRMDPAQRLTVTDLYAFLKFPDEDVSPPNGLESAPPTPRTQAAAEADGSDVSEEAPLPLNSAFWSHKEYLPSSWLLKDVLDGQMDLVDLSGLEKEACLVEEWWGGLVGGVERLWKGLWGKKVEEEDTRAADLGLDVEQTSASRGASSTIVRL